MGDIGRVPAVRVRTVNDAPVRGAGDFVLYWMIAARRTRSSFALDRAIGWARELGKPLLVLEALSCDYRWASDRLHRFVLDGMVRNRDRFAPTPIAYHPYVEPRPGAGKGLVEALAAHAAVVVTDDFPTSFLPRMVAAAGRRLAVGLEAVDSNGLLPMRAAEAVFPTAYAFRRFLQRELRPHLERWPADDPLGGLELAPLDRLPDGIERRWARAGDGLLAGDRAALAALPIDHRVPPAGLEGGSEAARSRLERFLAGGLDRYLERNQPDADATSGLSPWLHFGHLSVHEVVRAVGARDGWSPARLADRKDGRRGWWGMSEPAEAFLDELVTWRELGYNFCSKRVDHDRFESLPPWALATLRAHAADPRPHLYTRAELEEARTADPIWNAAERELVASGRMHNYLRMLWGKKILEWSPSPEEAAATMIDLNNRHALDGRDPNSVSGIFWVLGRYDRPWFPEREVFGTVRYMSSEATRKKLKLAAYLERWAG